MQPPQRITTSSAPARGGAHRVLTIHVGGQTYTVHPGQAPIIVGRDATAQVCIDDEHVSRTHLRLEHTPTGWVAVDQSRNGIFIDGTRAPQIPVTDATTIHLGHPNGTALIFTEDTMDPADPYKPDTDDDPETTMVTEATDPGIARAGAAVAARRKELDLPQRYLAANGIISAGSLIDFEKGRRWPRRANRAKLEAALRWPPGHIANIRFQRVEPDDEQTMALTNTVRMPMMAEVINVALDNITTTIKSLPATSDPDFTPRVNQVLSDLRRIEASAAQAARLATGDSSVALVLGAVRKTYKDLMLRAARAPGATLGQQLFAARHRAELTVGELANAAGVPVEAITAAEAEVCLDATTAAALAAALASLSVR
ncbi:FHA domain-containing protein [Mycobacterium kansasii]|uniref:FHA domain-containing protein n=1 Tax=Mycobacterium kansasii TaxID=1768 RepID=UPI003A86AC52